MRSLTSDEQTELATALGSARDRLLFLVGLYTGFRVHELLAIRFGDIWRNGQPVAAITLARRQLKGGAGANAARVRGRTVALHPSLRAAIQTYVSERFPDGQAPAEEFVFRSRKGDNQPITIRAAWRILKTAARRQGLDERVATHSMRKSFAKAVYEGSGHDLILTQRALGHRAITTTSRYLESTDEEVADAVLGITGPLRSLPGPTIRVESRPAARNCDEANGQQAFAL
jgi:integrase